MGEEVCSESLTEVAHTIWGDVHGLGLARAGFENTPEDHLSQLVSREAGAP